MDDTRTAGRIALNIGRDFEASSQVDQKCMEWIERFGKAFSKPLTSQPKTSWEVKYEYNTRFHNALELAEDITAATIRAELAPEEFQKIIQRSQIYENSLEDDGLRAIACTINRTTIKAEEISRTPEYQARYGARLQEETARAAAARPDVLKL